MICSISVTVVFLPRSFLWVIIFQVVVSSMVTPSGLKFGNRFKMLGHILWGTFPSGGFPVSSTTHKQQCKPTLNISVCSYYFLFTDPSIPLYITSHNCRSYSKIK